MMQKKDDSNPTYTKANLVVDEKPLAIWRLASSLSVVDAAILLAGGDPEDKEPPPGKSPFDLDVVYIKKTSSHPGFDAAFASLTSAILERELQASVFDFYGDPDWDISRINVNVLKTWLRFKGWVGGFFFADEEPYHEEFMEADHAHFSPELALAVAAWRGLVDVDRFPRGTKIAIDNWIKSNPAAWMADEPLSKNAKERIITVVNWLRKGGAPKGS